MAVAGRSRVLVLSDEPARTAEWLESLAEAGADVATHAFAELEADTLRSCQVAILDAGHRQVEGLRCLRRCRAHLQDSFVPILFIAGPGAPEARVAALEAGADTCLVQPFLPEELAAHCRAMLRLKQEYDRLRERTAEIAGVNRRLHAAYEQIDQELELAARVQQSFLPAAMPALDWVRFAVSYRPCGRVGGDFYDVFRLDEHHVGLYVADAMGHGVPASLLTIFLKHAVRGKDISDHSYRLVPPAEVLERVNRDLLAHNLADHRFVTMVYGLLDGRDGTLHYARAGHPYPLLIPAGGQPRLLQMEGSLLGVFETEFAGESCRLRPGDRVLLYTDGAEATAQRNEPAAQQLLGLAAEHRDLGIDALVDELTRRLLPAEGGADDLTLLGLQMGGRDDVPEPIIR